MNGQRPGASGAVLLADDPQGSQRPLTFPHTAPTRVRLEALLLLAAFGAFMASVQFSTYSLPDNDGYLHIRMATLMRQQGLTPAFPWLPLTILNPAEYANHHFLYHVALMPFTLLDLRLGAKLSAVTFAVLAFLAIWWLLRGQGVRYAALWALGLLAISDSFLFRMSATRAQALSLGFLAIGLHWLLKGRVWRLAALAFLYVWAYDGFPLLLMLGAVHALAVWLLLVVLLAGMADSYRGARDSIRRSAPFELFAGASAWLQANADPGERVFQTDWDDFPRLFFYNPGNTYLVGLDPTYLQLYDPALYARWVDVTQGEIEDPSHVILEEFGARFIVSDLRHSRFIESAERDPDMHWVYRDDLSVVYEIADWPR